jgi:hypothetical protein
MADKHSMAPREDRGSPGIPEHVSMQLRAEDDAARLQRGYERWRKAVLGTEGLSRFGYRIVERKRTDRAIGDIGIESDGRRITTVTFPDSNANVLTTIARHGEHGVLLRQGYEGKRLAPFKMLAPVRLAIDGPQDRVWYRIAGLDGSDTDIVEETVAFLRGYENGFHGDDEPQGTARLSRTEIEHTLRRLGFGLEPAHVKTRCARRGGDIVYIKQDSKSWLLVIAPANEDRLSELCAIGGVLRPNGRFWCHNSTMVGFEKRLASGRYPIPYGLDFDFETAEALEAFAGAMQSAPQARDDDRATETEAMRATRLGQTDFRNALLEEWNGRCAATGLAMPEMLRASHIKPWRDSSDQERLDVHNGLLLTVHLDALFDRHLVSFDRTGRILISPCLAPDDRARLGLHLELRIAAPNDTRERYLALHRAALRTR